MNIEASPWTRVIGLPGSNQRSSSAGAGAGAPRSLGAGDALEDRAADRSAQRPRSTSSSRATDPAWTVCRGSSCSEVAVPAAAEQLGVQPQPGERDPRRAVVRGWRLVVGRRPRRAGRGGGRASPAAAAEAAAATSASGVGVSSIGAPASVYSPRSWRSASPRGTATPGRRSPARRRCSRRRAGRTPGPPRSRTAATRRRCRPWLRLRRRPRPASTQSGRQVWRPPPSACRASPATSPRPVPHLRSPVVHHSRDIIPTTK